MTKLTIRLLDNCQTILKPGSGILYLSPVIAINAATPSRATKTVRMVTRSIFCLGGEAIPQYPNAIAAPHKLHRHPSQMDW